MVEWRNRPPDATLERVADAVMDPEYPVPGLFYTAEELAELDEVDERDDERWEAVAEYLRRHPEIDGGIRLGWFEGRRTVFVGLVGDAESHKGRLAEMVGERVAFERRPRTVGELAAIQDRVAADRTGLETAGLELLSLGTDRRRGVCAELVGGSGPAAAEDYVAERYGDAVAVRWLGPSRHREVPHPFGSWTSQHRQLRVFFGLDHNGQRRGSARVAEESGERIVIALTCLQPLGGRAVIDASAGVARPSPADLRSR